jgi:hypothetical protein
MENPRKLAGIGLICFLLFAVISLPARIPLQLIASESLRFCGVHGTVWQASIDTISLPGAQLRNAEWDLSLLRLLRGQIGGDLKSRWDGGFFEGAAAVSLLGTVSLQDAQANMTAAWLSGVAGLPRLDGQVSIEIDTLTLVDNWPEEFVGIIRADALSSTMIGAGTEGLLGNAIAEFDSTQETEAGVLTGMIRDDGGPLGLDGKLILRQPDSYNLSVQVEERSGASVALRQNLQFLGSPNADGRRVFEFGGSW